MSADTCDDARLDVVIVTYNSRPVIGRCLDSLLNSGAASIPTTIHVVDNASRDGTAVLVANKYPQVNLKRIPSNIGFGAANNTVLKGLRSQYVLVLNPDTEVPPGTLDHLLEFMASAPRAAVVGCLLLRNDGTIDHACKRELPTPVSALRYFLGLPSEYTAESLAPDSTGIVGAVNGAFMLVRVAAMREVGLFDQRYWMYGEDLDWCARFADANWEVWYDGSVWARHMKGASSGKYRTLRTNWHFHKSMIVFYVSRQGSARLPSRALVVAAVLARFAVVQVISMWHRYGLGRKGAPRLADGSGA